MNENELIELLEKKNTDYWADKEKLKQALEWDAKQRQPMQILEDGRIVPVFKELTDEEIKQLAYQHRWNGDVEFARAILRKASEK